MLDLLPILRLAIVHKDRQQIRWLHLRNQTNKVKMNRYLLCTVLLCSIIYSCKNNDTKPCKYNLDQLLSDTAFKFDITYKYDTIIVVTDIMKDSSSSGSNYVFGNDKKLRRYLFLVNGDEYRYSEEYDNKGNFIKNEGIPLVKYEVFSKNNDTLVFIASLFSLNKKYDGIEIIVNSRDTINIKYLFKSKLYSNMKTFSFKLPFAKAANGVSLYTNGAYINECTAKRLIFSDTTEFFK
jgi:hypothetical protein